MLQAEKEKYPERTMPHSPCRNRYPHSRRVSARISSRRPQTRGSMIIQAASRVAKMVGKSGSVTARVLPTETELRPVPLPVPVALWPPTFCNQPYCPPFPSGVDNTGK